jgi:hypothetical protein
MKTNRTIRNNATGETLTMLVSEGENGGACQVNEVHLPPHRPVLLFTTLWTSPRPSRSSPGSWTSMSAQSSAGFRGSQEIASQRS